MSTTIDERVVSMKFNNQQFQSGVADSLNSINKLKSGLNFKGATKGLDDVGNSASKVNFNGMSSGIEAVSLKFSALQVAAVTALANITNSAVNAGINLVKSLTIDPVMDGYADYGRKLTSIQTITNATGKSLKDVAVYFNELDTYADKTIYNLDDMTSAMAKFTNAGVDLDKSVPAIKGIANMVAVAGQDAGAAQIAFYNLSQSIAGGFLTTMDYKSLNLANVATKEWKDQMIAGAIAAGTLKDAGNGMYMIKGGKEAVTGAALFNEELSKGWATTNVLLDVLGKYGDTNTAIGAKAQAAAQDVKSFSMMMETLKASAGTGWTDTFEILVGNLEEAKALFTPLTATIGGFLDSISKTRNDLLGGWKDLGGRTALIDSIKNAFDGVMGVATALGRAFRDVFPATTSAQLFSLTEGLKSLTEKMKLSDGTLYNLRSTFKGVFAILDIGKTIFLAVVNAVGILFGGVSQLGPSILGVTASFGEWLTALANIIKQSDIFNKILTPLAYGLKNGFGGIASILESITRGLGLLASAIGAKLNFPGFEIFHSFLDLIGTRMTGVGDETTSMVTIVGNAFVSMGKAIANSKVGEICISIWDTIKMVAGAIGTLIGKLSDTIANSLKNADFNTVLDAIAAMSIGGMFLAFKKFMKGLSDPLKEAGSIFDSIKGSFKSITGALDGVRSSLESYQQNLKAGILLKIAIAIGILSASIVAISLIDSDKLVSSLAAIGTLFAQLLVAMKLYSLIGEFKGKVIKASIVMLAMSTSILILSGAMKNIAELDWNGVAKGSVGILAMAGILVASAKILSSGSKSMIKGSAGMVIFAAAIKILASACIDLAQLNWEQLKMGLIGVGVLMAEISLFLNTAKFSIKSIATATGIVILAGAIKILASACKDLGSMDWGDLVKGLEAIGLLLAGIAIFSNTTGNAKNVISTSVAMIAMGAAMKILASALKDFGSMDWGDIVKGLEAMGMALAGITLTMNLLPKDMISKGAGLIIVGAALKIIASALKDFGGMNWEELKLGLMALGGSLGILAIGLFAMNGSLAGTAALLVAAGALAILAPTLVLLGTMSWDNIIRGLTMLAGTIAIFGISAALLTPILPSMFGLAGALVLIGVAILGVGAGLALAGVGLSALATGITLLAGVTATGATAIVAALGIIIVGVAALIPAVMTKIGEGIVAFIKVFTTSIPAILECITAIIKAIVDCIVKNIPVILEGVFKTLSSILDAILKWVPSITQKVVDIILALLKVIADNIGKFTKAAVDIIIGFIKGITDSLPKIIDSAFKLIITFINGLADAIRNNSDAIGNACLNLVTAIVDGIGKLQDKFMEAGVYAVKGFIKGLVSMPGKLWDAGKELGMAALNAAKNALDEHSPSRAMKQVGVYAGEGLVIGLDNMRSKVATSSANMGYTAVDNLSNAIAGISDVINDDIPSQPVIRPVLDLTDVQNGSNQLYRMMDDLGTYGIDGSINAANSKARSISSKQLLMNDVTASIEKSGVSDKQGVKQPITLQLMLQNGRAIAEYIIDDVDNLMGNKTKITGRMVGV